MGRTIAVAAGGAGFASSGPVGALAGYLGTETVLAMRRAGLEKVDDLIADAMLNPERAKALLATVKGKPDKLRSHALARLYAKTAPRVPIGSDGERDSGPRQAAAR